MSDDIVINALGAHVRAWVSEICKIDVEDDNIDYYADLYLIDFTDAYYDVHFGSNSSAVPVVEQMVPSSPGLTSVETEAEPEIALARSNEGSFSKSDELATCICG